MKSKKHNSSTCLGFTIEEVPDEPGSPYSRFYVVCCLKCHKEHLKAYGPELIEEEKERLQVAAYELATDLMRLSGFDCMKEGWGIFNGDEIQRDDEADILPDDTSAAEAARVYFAKLLERMRS